MVLLWLGLLAERARWRLLVLLMVLYFLEGSVDVKRVVNQEVEELFLWFPLHMLMKE